MPQIQSVSYEFIRQQLIHVDKFELKKALYGSVLYAHQDVREIRKLYTYYVGQRCELDYTKFGKWCYPNANWSEPRFYFFGFAFDHHSKCFKGYTVTTAPSGRDAIRLYRNAVLPKSFWLPPHLRQFAQEWDVFGLDDLVAIDNAMDLLADATILMFGTYCVIVLRMPARRGDYKGTVERNQHTFETQCISRMVGYVPSPFGETRHHWDALNRIAKSKTTDTVADVEKALVEYGVHRYNYDDHPTLKKPRIAVYRESRERTPLLLPTGILQLRTAFALTKELTLTRSGVEFMEVFFNSTALHKEYRTNTGKVIVKVTPDDLRSVLVFLPQVAGPIEATLTTFEVDFPLSWELLDIVVNRAKERYPNQPMSEVLPTAFPQILAELQSGTSVVSKFGGHKEAQAATHAARAPDAGAMPLRPGVDEEFDAALKKSRGQSQ